MQRCYRHRQAGTAAVEFSLTILIFFVLVMGIFEFGRVVFAWNAAAEATRAGARVASVSTMYSENIGEAMRTVIADLKDSQIAVNYLPAGCNPDNCEAITVSVLDYAVSPLMVPVPVLPVPTSTTTVQRESLGVT
jgi:Flp pilus assembly protein TadG